MFTVDLLNGGYIPLRSTPKGVGVAVVTFLIPSVVAIFILGYYMQNRVLISVHKQAIAGYEKSIGRLSEGVELQKSIEEQKDTIRASLGEVFSCLGGYDQWSPALVAVAENMPVSVLAHPLLARD